MKVISITYANRTKTIETSFKDIDEIKVYDDDMKTAYVFYLNGTVIQIFDVDEATSIKSD